MTKSDKLALHFVTLVGFGFISGCATIVRLENAAIMVGIPSFIALPPVYLVQSCSDLFLLSMVSYL
jgi:hypothetical protein